MIRVESEKQNARGETIAYDLMPLRYGTPRHNEEFTRHDLWVSQSHPERPHGVPLRQPAEHRQGRGSRRADRHRALVQLGRAPRAAARGRQAQLRAAASGRATTPGRARHWSCGAASTCALATSSTGRRSTRTRPCPARALANQREPDRRAEPRDPTQRNRRSRSDRTAPLIATAGAGRPWAGRAGVLGCRGRQHRCVGLGRCTSLRTNQTASPQTNRATLIFCDRVMPAKTAGSSPRSASIGQRVSGVERSSAGPSPRRAAAPAGNTPAATRARRTRPATA